MACSESSLYTYGTHKKCRLVLRYNSFSGIAIVALRLLITAWVTQLPTCTQVIWSVQPE